ncbi:hypothetical protein [Streptomyces bauhiniae]|uniref:hypothetical protein n=1 Tax=Streptomyces bauhiniae TaxID=2340725 RepID=UPI0035DF6893
MAGNAEGGSPLGDGFQRATRAQQGVAVGAPKRVNTRRETKDAKSRAGRRPIGIPDPLVQLLLQHGRTQERDRRLAGDLWTEKGYVFASPTGKPLNPKTGRNEWKDLLKAAGLRAGRPTTPVTRRRPSC